MKIIAGIGLLFFAYCAFQVVSKWEKRNATEKAIWFVVIIVGAGTCLMPFMR